MGVPILGGRDSGVVFPLSLFPSFPCAAHDSQEMKMLVHWIGINGCFGSFSQAHGACRSGDGAATRSFAFVTGFVGQAGPV